MPEPLRRICAASDERLTPLECAAYRARWDRDGGPLGLNRALQASRAGQVSPVRRTTLGMAVPEKARLTDCSHLGQWTGRLCQH